MKYRFGPFSIDSDSRLLFRDVERIPLPPKAADVLLALVERDGELVTKDELLKEVWPDTFVEEGNLARHIFLLRKTLGETSEGASYVETVPKRGYRFIGPVRREHLDAVTLTADQRTSEHIIIEETETQALSDMGPARRTMVVALGTLAASSLGWTAAVYFMRRQSQAHPGGEIRSLAVLPLKPLTSDPQDKLLEIGMADTVISKVSRVGGLIVRPTSAVRKYAAENVHTLAAAKELQVQSVLEGTLQRAGNKLRITVNLLRVDDGASLWSETFDTTTTDVFEIQDEIARQLAGRLHARIQSVNSQKLERRETSSLQALQAFQAALQDFDRRSFTSTGDAIPLFERAIRFDPQYARAHALLSYCFAWHALFIDPPHARMWIAKAEDAARAADRVSTDLAETHLVRGELLWSEHFNWRIDDAVREFQNANALDSNIGHSELGTIFGHLGLLERTKHHLERALEVDPLGSTARGRYVEQLASLGEYEDAVKANRRLFNNNGPIEALIALGRAAEAKPLIEDALRMSSAPRVLANYARLLAMEGRFVEAERLIPGIEQGRLDRGYHHAAISVAGLFALQGKSNHAVKWLQISAKQGMPNYLLFSRDPSFDRIRSHGEFQRFVADLKRTWEQYRQRYA